VNRAKTSYIFLSESPDKTGTVGALRRPDFAPFRLGRENISPGSSTRLYPGTG
jgi:hypothetical protein